MSYSKTSDLHTPSHAIETVLPCPLPPEPSPKRYQTTCQAWCMAMVHSVSQHGRLRRKVSGLCGATFRTGSRGETPAANGLTSLGCFGMMSITLADCRFFEILYCPYRDGEKTSPCFLEVRKWFLLLVCSASWILDDPGISWSFTCKGRRSSASA